MLNFLISRPIGVTMTTLAVVIISFVFLGRIPISLLSDIPIPTIAVQVSAPDMDARTLENTVTRTLRNELLQVNNLKDISSRSRNGSALLRLTLDYGINTSLSFIEVNEKIDQVMHLLPRDMGRPRVIKTNVSDIPVFTLHMIPESTIREFNLLELSQFAENVIKRRLEQLKEIAFVDIHGMAFPEVVVKPDKEVMTSLNISQDVIERALQNANIEMGNILIRDGAYQYGIRLRTRLVTVDDIKSLYLKVDDRLFQLGDLATVRLEEEQRKGSFIVNDNRAIVFSVRKKSNANNYSLRRNVASLMAAFETDYPGLHFVLSNDQSQILESSINSLKTSLFFGLTFAGLILFAFFRDWRPPILIITGVPISLLVTLLFFYLLDISINIISLTGLLLGIGLMIDNSIIIIENIQQKRIQMCLLEAAAQGAQEVVRPLIASALTTSSVFLPLILLSGLAGAMFYDQALSITIALLVSVTTSYFVLPVIAAFVLKTNGAFRERRKRLSHSSMIGWIVTQRKWLLPLFLLTGLASLFLFPEMKKQAFPDITREYFEIGIDWNEPIDLAESERRGKVFYDDFHVQIREIARYHGEVQFMLAKEDPEFNESRFVVAITNNSGEHFRRKVKDWFIKHHPVSVVSVQPAPNVLDRIFRTDKPPVSISIQSMQTLGLPPYKESVVVVDGLRDIIPGLEIIPVEAIVTLEILQEKLLVHGVLYDEVIDKLRSILRNNRITELRSSDRIIPVQVSEKEGQDLEVLLRGSYIQTPGGQRIPIGEFIELGLGHDYKNIESGKGGEHILLTTSEYFDGMEQQVRDRIANLGAYTVQFGGSFYENRRLIRELLKISLVVIVLLFLILAAQFESLIQPMVVALTLPVGIFGALLALYLAGESINIMALVGIIIMSGIDVNDAILKIDIINRNHRMGMSLIEAIVDGSERRIRPIIMTSLTTMLAMTPMLFTDGLGAELQRPLAIAVMGGLTLGTVASIVMIPMFYKITVK